MLRPCRRAVQLSARSGPVGPAGAPDLSVAQPPSTWWLTGLSGAGKSTLAEALSQALVARGVRCFVLDGDVVRAGLCRDLGFSAADRQEHIRRVAEVARLMNEAGLQVICALISPARADREMARQIIGAEAFIEVYLATPLQACEARDPKGLYKRARAGSLPGFTGIDAPYEAPEAPAVGIDTSAESVETSLQQLLSLWAERR
ncbi:MAG: adenylyl-sulfate kinase [Burkholderiaceae bacterium]|nr:adenylyl-sulfate kinase [Burkholderiaceae bacterium]